MKIAVDTNRYSDFARDDPDTLIVFERATEIVIPFAALAELRGGFLIGSKTRQNEEKLEAWLNTPGVRIGYADRIAIKMYASLYATLRRNGTPIPVNDMWIAAIVLRYGLTLYTRDRHFDVVPNLNRL